MTALWTFFQTSFHSKKGKKVPKEINVGVSHGTSTGLSLPLNIIIPWHFPWLLSKLANTHQANDHSLWPCPRLTSITDDASSSHQAKTIPRILNSTFQTAPINYSEIAWVKGFLWDCGTNGNPIAIDMSLTEHVPRHKLILFPQSISSSLYICVFIKDNTHNPDIQMT